MNPGDRKERALRLADFARYAPMNHAANKIVNALEDEADATAALIFGIIALGTWAAERGHAHRLVCVNRAIQQTLDDNRDLLTRLAVAEKLVDFGSCDACKMPLRCPRCSP